LLAEPSLSLCGTSLGEKTAVGNYKYTAMFRPARKSKLVNVL
jgi:hypothetical protein